MKWASSRTIHQRTFIQPTQELRGKVVDETLCFRRCKRQSVWLWLMTLLRGTTSRRIVQLLKEAGATEVHAGYWQSTASLSMFLRDWYPNRQELIANHTVEETRQIIGADSLTYLLLRLEWVNWDWNGCAKWRSLCRLFWWWPSTTLYDYEEDYRRSLEERPVFYKWTIDSPLKKRKRRQNDK